MCACYLIYRLSVVKQSYCVSLENPTTEGDLDFGGFIHQNYQTWSCRPQRPMSGASQAQSLTRQNGLATKNSLGSLGLPAFFLFPKSHELFGSPVWIGYLCGLSHEKDYAWPLTLIQCKNIIIFDNSGYIRLNKNKGLNWAPCSYLNPSDYPPKLSNIIISSSTPSECKRSSTVFDIIGGPHK